MASIGASEFDTATAVGPDGSAAIVPGWSIGENANGGYLLAMAARHMCAVAGRADPVTVTAHYLAPGTPGPVQIDARVVKAGQRFGTVSAAVERDGRPMMQVLGAFGQLSIDHDVVHLAVSPPELPPIEACIRREGVTIEIPLLDRVDILMRPGDLGFASGQPSGVAEVAGYFRFTDGRPVDTLSLLLVCDSFAPAVFNLGLPSGWVPTVEYTVQIRGVPAPGPLRCLFRTRVVQNGMLEEDGEVWDADGRLVALSRQLGLLARPTV